MATTDFLALWEILEEHLGSLVMSIAGLPDIKRESMRDYIDHNEFGIAFEELIETISDMELLLNQEQRQEMAHLASLMALPPSVLAPLK
ncbi:MafI family immunity protein [Nitrospirillum amazonense]|uniref:Uncharacterized protein n=1 Tax=Nitrospirillum amazonense TaxID=28077 RepID=A0A560JW27_9PROT|nr:MafI family immunity protein [Nitrospirillum amazonense]MDG3440456.1 MafI family immunity protein [Nitrospirillum amazonense]TWB75207.1 hypothetical protein FBZ87_104310 [Nitrospirillum amazonense]